MSGIVLFRIDERLVHGQVVTAWLGHTQAEEILVVDDATAQDSLLRSIVKMAVPPQVEVQIAALEEAEELLAELEAEARVMVIVKHPESARKKTRPAAGNVPPQAGFLISAARRAEPA